MSIRFEPNTDAVTNSGGLELAALLHPGSAYSRPDDVVRDPDLTTYEKRAILASWASDARAVESAPALRIGPQGQPPVTVDEVMEALRALDRQGGVGVTIDAPYRRVLSKRWRGNGLGVNWPQTKSEP